MDARVESRDTTESLTQRIRRSGLKATKPRRQVLLALAQEGGHLSADQVREVLQTRGVRLPRASVYNALRDLARAGILQLADTGPGRALFEYSTSWHHHFVCRNCGLILDVPCVSGMKPCMTPELEGCEVDEAQIIFRGICSACRRR
jgi:Fe2+ or Zn2+ uptake regulation protein